MERIGKSDPGRRERRKFQRARGNVFIFCKLKGDYKAIEGISKDISETGLGFESDRFVPPATLMEMEIYQPLNRLKNKIVSIYLLAKVVWIKEIRKRSKYKGSNRYMGGVKFTRIRKQDRDIIAKYMKLMLKKRK